MKKIFFSFLCFIIILSAIPCSVFAEGIQTSNEATVAETTAGSAISAPEELSKASADQNDGSKTVSDQFEEWLLPHFEEISVIIALIVSAFYNMKKHKLLNKSIGTMNNNTVTIAQNTSNMMSQAISNMSNTANIVTAYDARIAAMLEAHKTASEDKERLERELLEIKAYLKTAAQANIEFSNELAELLNLANIPNFKKEEIGARHLAAVNAIQAAENEALAHTVSLKEEVSTDVGEKS